MFQIFVIDNHISKLIDPPLDLVRFLERKNLLLPDPNNRMVHTGHIPMIQDNFPSVPIVKRHRSIKIHDLRKNPPGLRLAAIKLVELAKTKRLTAREAEVVDSIARESARRGLTKKQYKLLWHLANYPKSRYEEMYNEIKHNLTGKHRLLAAKFIKANNLDMYYMKDFYTKALEFRRLYKWTDKTPPREDALKKTPQDRKRKKKAPPEEYTYGMTGIMELDPAMQEPKPTGPKMSWSEIEEKIDQFERHQQSI